MKAYHFCTQISPISINEKFFGKTTQFSIMLSASLFVKNVKRILTVDPEL